jgi:hypothetical protein
MKVKQPSGDVKDTLLAPEASLESMWNVADDVDEDGSAQSRIVAEVLKFLGST